MVFGCKIKVTQKCIRIYADRWGFNEGMQLFYGNRDCNIKSIAITADAVIADRLGVNEREIDFLVNGIVT